MTNGATVLELTTAYASFGNGGNYYEPYCYYKILDSQGNTLIEKEPEKTKSTALSENHIAGINQTIAKNIVTYRTENGAFTDRKQLKKVAKLGPKAFEQCAGFLRVSGAKNPLDNTAVHPESYGAAEQILQECGFRLADIAGQDRSEIGAIAKQHGISAIAKKAGVGEPTVRDILKELDHHSRMEQQKLS